jgi:hypothetical protein
MVPGNVLVGAGTCPPLLLLPLSLSLSLSLFPPTHAKTHTGTGFLSSLISHGVGRLWVQGAADYSLSAWGGQPNSRQSEVKDEVPDL